MAETKVDSASKDKERIKTSKKTTDSILSYQKKANLELDKFLRRMEHQHGLDKAKKELENINTAREKTINSIRDIQREELDSLTARLSAGLINEQEYQDKRTAIHASANELIAKAEAEDREKRIQLELTVVKTQLDAKLDAASKLATLNKAYTTTQQRDLIDQANQLAKQQEEESLYEARRLKQLKKEQEQIAVNSSLSDEERQKAQERAAEYDAQQKMHTQAIIQAQSIQKQASEELDKWETQRHENMMKNLHTLADRGDTSTQKIAEEYLNSLKAEKEALENELELKKAEVALELNDEALQAALDDLDKQYEKRSEQLDKQINELATNDRLIQSQDAKDAEEIEEAVKDYINSLTEAEKRDRKEKLKNKAILGDDSARKKALDSQLKDALRDIANQLANMVDQKIGSFYENQAKINARLQGADTNYQKALFKIGQNVSLSPFVSQNKVIEKLNTLVDSGVAYNLELRAYLGTISEKIASTFDAFDSNLLRLIKVQQADTTAARLGMEAALTRLFNSYFSDTSYLSSLADTVSQQLIEANSQLTRDMSLAFEYTVQKWLGSLYSVGFSDQGISLIADAINSLGSGNVEALSSNENAMNLVAMSASRIGLNIGEILNNGLNSNTTNQLLCSMVEYLQEIARNSKDNQVAKNALAGAFGLTMSDIRSVTNLTGLDINKILFENEIKNYETATSELESQMNMLFDREHISNMVSTLVDNLYTTAATGIGGNALSYGLWKAVGLLKDSTGGINIPSIMAAGFGVDLNADVLQLIQAGMMGLPVITSIVNQIGSAFHEGNGGSEFDKWGFTEFTPRGSAIKGITGGATSGKSSSISLGIGSNSALDLENTTLQNEVDRAEEKDKIINQHSDLRENQLNDALFTEDTDVITQLIEINEKLDSLQAISAAVQSMAVPELESGTSLDSSTTGTPVDPVTGNKPSAGGIISPPTGTSSTNNSTSVSGESQQSSSVSNTQATGVEEIPEMMEALYGEVVDFHKDFLSRTQPQTFDNTNVSNRLVRPFNDKQLHMLAQQSQAIQNLETTLSTYDIDTISKLMAETAVSASYLKEEAIHKKDEYKNNTKTNMNVSITEMSPEVTSFLAATIKTMVSSALVGEQSVDDTSTSLLQAITTALTTSNLNVKVTNDNFDTALQKYAFMN